MKISFLGIWMVIAIAAILNSCHEKRDVVPGKHRFTLQVDGYAREYYVHVPKGYDSKMEIPVVFMLHGSGGNGERFYNISGWKEVGEIENILTVFPSSFTYPCVFDDGVNKKNIEKWTSYDLELCGKSVFVDDVKFLSAILESLETKYLINEKRVYLVGFSNGGGMASRAAIELSDKLAAVVACAGTLPMDSSFTPLRKLPYLLQVGNMDDRILSKLGTTQPLPMDIELLYTQFPTIKQLTNSISKTFSLDSSYATGGDSTTFIYADYTNAISNPKNSFRFLLVNDLGHNYPNGKNHPMKGAEVHWEWMKNFHLR